MREPCNHDESCAFEPIGLNPEKGIGLAAAQTYHGGAEGLAEYVLGQYEYEYAGAPHPMAATISDQQARLDMVGQTAGSVGAPTQADVLADAEVRGDHATTMRIKGQQI